MADSDPSPLGTTHESTSSSVNLDSEQIAPLIHLSALASGPFLPLLIWALQKDESEWLDRHGKEAINFNLSWLIWFVALNLGSLLFVFITLGFGMIFFPVYLIALGALGLAWFVFVVVAAVRSANGQFFAYPLKIRFIK